jgi:CheY-like chemotaxis protein/nitrogen-specific signal transduction histidine kinase
LVISGKPYFDTSGTFAGYRGTGLDVTPQVRVENELRAIAEDLDEARVVAESANAAKSQFLAMMSHEIRTPMTGLMGMVELLRGTILNDRQTGYVTALKTSADSLLSILNDILDISKFEAGELSLEIVDFSIPRVVEEVVELFRGTAADKGLVLSLAQAPDGVVMARGDPTRLKQILSNLINNGLKFTSDGSVQAWLGAREENGQVVIDGTVRDTGIGIEKEQLGRLFQAFSQADETTTRRFGGTGLGLAICKRLVEAMDGDIAVESTPDVGTSFHFTVRMLPSALSVAEAEAVLAEPRARDVRAPARVLLAEDNALNAMLISTMLTRWGHEVEIVGDGQDAVYAVVDSDFDLVLMDMQMPKMDGPDATRMIRSMGGPFLDLPIIGLSGDAMPEHRERYIEAGLDEFLTKPVEWSRLSEVIDRFMETGRRGSLDPKPDPTEIGLLDEARLAALRSALPPDRVRSMLSMLGVEMVAHVTELRDAEPPEGVRRLAHRLKGMAGNFGATKVEELSRRLQVAAEAGDATDDLIEAISQSVAETADRINKMVESL